MAEHDIFDNENERRVTEEFLEELSDAVSELNVLLGNVRSSAVTEEDGLAELRRTLLAINTQVQGQSLPMAKLLIHRLSEYVFALKSIDNAALDDLQVYLDRLEALANGDDIAEEAIPSLIRALPAKRHELEAEFGTIEPKNIEVLLVIPEKAMSRIVERELAACGYRTSMVRDPFAAIETAVRTRPDFVVAAMELGGLSGVDLAAAFAAISVTKDIPFAILTSYESGHQKLKGLPPSVALLHKGARFGDDLAETLARFKIT